MFSWTQQFRVTRWTLCERFMTCTMINLSGWWTSRLGSSRRVLVYSVSTQFQQLEFWNNFVISVRKWQRFAWGIDTSRWQTMMSVMMMMMMTALLCRHIYTVNSQTVRAFFVLFCFVSLQETDRTPCLQRKKKMYACRVCEWVGLLYTPCRPGALLRPPPPPYLTLQFHFAFLPKRHTAQASFLTRGKNLSASSLIGRRCCHLVPVTYPFVSFWWQIVYTTNWN